MSSSTVLFRYLLFGRTGADAGPVVLEQMLRTVLDACGSVCVLARRVALQAVLGRVVDLHGWALLLAHPLVIEILARLQMLAKIISTQFRVHT